MYLVNEQNRFLTPTGEGATRIIHDPPDVAHAGGNGGQLNETSP